MWVVVWRLCFHWEIKLGMISGVMKELQVSHLAQYEISASSLWLQEYWP